MKTEVWPPGPPDCTTFMPGTRFRISVTVRSCCAAISSAVMTVTLLPSWDAGVAIRVAETTRVSSGAAWPELSSALPGRTQRIRQTAPATGAHNILDTIFLRNNDTKCRRSGLPAAHDAPRPEAWTTAQGWSPDFRAIARGRLPPAQ